MESAGDTLEIWESRRSLSRAPNIEVFPRDGDKEMIKTGNRDHKTTNYTLAEATHYNQRRFLSASIVSSKTIVKVSRAYM